MTASDWGDSALVPTFPPFLIKGNSAPDLIPAYSIQFTSAFTAHAWDRA